MSEKRRSSGRIKAETPSKKKARLEEALISKKPRGKPPTPEKPEKSGKLEKTEKPAKVKDATSKAKKEKSLPIREYTEHGELDAQELKSVAESGVLVASLRQSRSKWLSDGPLQRYWTKPAKKKDQKEIANNPPKETMQKIGTCTLFADPHGFEASVYLIRDPPYSQPAMKAAQRPFVQYGVPNGAKLSYQHQYQQQQMAYNRGPSGSIPAHISQSSVSPIPPYHNSPYPSYTPTTAASSPALPSATVNNIAPESPATLSPTLKSPDEGPPSPPKSSAAALETQASIDVAGADPPVVKPEASPLSTTTPTAPEAPQAQSAPSPPAPPKPNQDPVIQMLATRASTNPDLKALMKVVASGDASQEQLRIFQSHIDDLNAIIQRQMQAPPPNRNLPTPTPPHYSRPNTHVSPYPDNSRVTPYGHGTPTYPPNMPHRPQPYMHSPHPPLPIPKPPPVNPYAGYVCFEFAGGSGDRFLLPRHTILEAVPGRQEFIASFLVVRKGSDSDGDFYVSKSEYYQPVTVRLVTEIPRVFEAIWKSVAPPDQVRNHMADVMSKYPKAEVVHLELQLPIDVESFHDGSNNVDVKGAKAASAIEIKQGRQTRARQDDLDKRCRFCFAELTSAVQSPDDDQTCRTCNAIRRGKPAALYTIPGIKYSHFNEPSATQSLAMSSVVV